MGRPRKVPAVAAETPGDAQSPPTAQNPYPINSPQYFVWHIEQIDRSAASGHVGSALEAKRQLEYWRERAAGCGIDLRDEAEAKLDPIRRLLANPNLSEHAENDLRQIREAVAAASALEGAEDLVKKKWLSLIDQALELQETARSSPLYFSVYVLRCQETGEVLRMEQIHCDIFRTWNDPHIRNSEILAPPGSGKTTCMYGQDLWDIADDTRVRMIKSSMTLPNSRKRVDVVRGYIEQSKRFRALCPHVRLDYAKPNNADEFTVIRPNIGSQDPTMRAAGATSSTQGAGGDILDVDDLCPQEVRYEKTTRDRITETFFSVTLQRRRNLLRSRVRYIATPWDIDDTTARLRNAIREGKLVDWKLAVFPVGEQADGTPIPVISRPGEDERLKQVKQTDPSTYALCYRLDPRADRVRKLRWLTYYDESGGTDPLCPEDKREFFRKQLAAINSAERWQVLDPAAGGADQTGMVGFAISPGGRAAVTSARFFRNNATETMDMVLDVVVSDSAEHVLIESQGPMKGVANLWQSYLVARLGPDFEGRVHFAGTRMKGAGNWHVGQNISKDERWYNVIPWLEGSSVIFPGRWEMVNGQPRLVASASPGLAQLHEQMMNGPGSGRDDGLDCVSLFINEKINDLVRTIPAHHLVKPAPKVQSVNVLTALYRQTLERRTRHADEDDRAWEAALFVA